MISFLRAHRNARKNTKQGDPPFLEAFLRSLCFWSQFLPEENSWELKNFKQRVPFIAISNPSAECVLRVELMEGGCEGPQSSCFLYCPYSQLIFYSPRVFPRRIGWDFTVMCFAPRHYPSNCRVNCVLRPQYLMPGAFLMPRTPPRLGNQICSPSFPDFPQGLAPPLSWSHCLKTSEMHLCLWELGALHVPSSGVNS